MRYFILTIAALTALVLIAPVTIAFTSLAAAEQGASSSSLCGPGGLAAQPTADLPASVAGYSGQQLENAAAIMRAGVTLDVGLHGQTLAVMTAMGESSLINVDYGDAVGPDSRGLFQQRDNGAWGSYTDRMDPQTAASNFYRALLRVEDWEILPPTVAAHRVQRNADVNHYARYWSGAVEVVTALADLPPCCSRRRRFLHFRLRVVQPDRHSAGMGESGSGTAHFAVRTPHPPRHRQRFEPCWL